MTAVERLSTAPAVAADPERLLSPAEAAAFLGVHPATLRKLKARGQIAYVALGRGRYRRADLIAYRDALVRRRGVPLLTPEPERRRRPATPAGLVGWNEVTGRPFGYTAEQWTATGLTRRAWEAQHGRQPAEASSVNRRASRKRGNDAEDQRTAQHRRSMQSPEMQSGRAPAALQAVPRPSVAGARPPKHNERPA